MARLNASLHDSLTDDIIGILFSKKIYTVTDFLGIDTKLLTKITSLTYKEVVDIRKQILSHYSAEILNGAEYYNYLLNNTTITPTNINNLDNLLGGGIMSGNIYEFCGFAASGKTQICLTVAANFSYFFQKLVYFIDTKRDFSTSKIQTLLEKRKCNEETCARVLNEIKVKEINDQYQLISALYEIKAELTAGVKCPLIIIDSLPAVYYHTGNYSSTLTMMNHFVNIIRNMAVRLNTAFIVTNIMIKDNLSTGTIITKPGLGTYWNNVPNTRMLLTKTDKNTCKMTVLKSTTIECNKLCDVTITDLGIV